MLIKRAPNKKPKKKARHGYISFSHFPPNALDSVLVRSVNSKQNFAQQKSRLLTSTQVAEMNNYAGQIV